MVGCRKTIMVCIIEAALFLANVGVGGVGGGGALLGKRGHVK